eukprot:6183479-Pleurochrysis_carterae.AAC.1
MGYAAWQKAISTSILASSPRPMRSANLTMFFATQVVSDRTLPFRLEHRVGALGRSSWNSLRDGTCSWSLRVECGHTLAGGHSDALVLHRSRTLYSSDKETVTRRKHSVPRNSRVAHDGMSFYS